MCKRTMKNTDIFAAFRRSFCQENSSALTDGRGTCGYFLLSSRLSVSEDVLELREETLFFAFRWHGVRRVLEAFDGRAFGIG